MVRCGRRAVTSRPAVEVGEQLRLGEHPPAEAEPDRLVEVGAGRDQVHDVGLGDAAGAEDVVLERVLGVEDDHRHPLPVVAAAAGATARPAPGWRRAGSAGSRGARTGSPGPGAGRWSRRPAPHRCAAARPSRPGPRPPAAARASSSRPPRPATSRNQVASESAFTATATSTRPPCACERRADLVVEQPGLTPEPDQRGAGLGRLRTACRGVRRPGPTSRSSARIRWLTALGVTCSGAGRGLERAVVGDRHQRLDGGGVVRHEAMLMNRAETFAGLHPRPAPSVAACSTPPSPACSPACR